MLELTLENANAMIAGAFAKARELGLKPIGVAVLDAGGHVLSFQREDTGAAIRLQLAVGKASGALAVGASSRTVAEIAKEYPSIIAKLDTVAMGGIIAAGGALLFGDDNGRVLGAVGASGDSSENDEACSRAGIEAVGFRPLD